jgi:ATP-binding cassette, subfamily B, bacterial
VFFAVEIWTFSRGGNMQFYFSLFSTYLRPQWWRVLLLAVLILAGIGVQLANPQIIRYVLDQAQGNVPQGQLLLAAGIFLLFGIAQAAVTLGSTYLGTDISWSATNRLRADLALHCLRLDMAFHNAHTPGELIERVDGDATKLASFFSQLVLKVIANGLLILGVILLLYREDWRMGLAATFYAALVFGLLRAVQERTVRLWSKISVADAGLNSLLEERLTGREDVRANGGEEYVLWRLAKALGERFRAVYAARWMATFTFASSHMLFVVARVLALAIGIYLFFNGQITIGTIYLIVYYVGILQAPLIAFRDQLGELHQAAASVGRVRDLFEQKSLVQTETVAASANRLPATSLSVQFEDVSFQYVPQNGHDGDRHRVISDLSFELPAGRVLGLLGRTGSGKTTLTRLLFRLFEPTAGAIRLGGEDICNVSLREVRRRVGLVTQEVQLFGGTLRDNITLFNPEVDDEAILAALRELGLWNWFLAQPAGLETRLESGGSGLSAGEAQLLAFVRIFLKDPGLVVLDEASSRLDPATEQLLERAIDHLLHNRTAIIIAHRLESVQRADDILILEDGRIAEFGPRVALMADPDSRFTRLLRTGLQEVIA